MYVKIQRRHQAGNQIIPYLVNYQTGHPLSTKLRQFCEHFITTGYSLRSYSLNYDRSIPLVFENRLAKNEIFDGFDIPNTYMSTDLKELNLLNKTKVMDDRQCHSYYNLHGSFHWSFQEADYKITRSNYNGPLYQGR